MEARLAELKRTSLQTCEDFKKQIDSKSAEISELNEQLQLQHDHIAELKAEREKLAFRITDLLNESIDSGMEIRKLKADILNFKEWYREANAATRVKVLEKLNKIA